MTSDIGALLKKLGISDTGYYDNHTYIIPLEDSEAYAKMYSLLDTRAINTEYPVFTQNSNKNTTKVVNYFETAVDSDEYTIFLTADFENENYYIRIREKLAI